MVGFIKKIEKINFGILSPEDIREMSVVTVETPDTYEDDGFPIEKGLMDLRLGVIDPSLVCTTCGFRGGDCQGHFGSIELARPVIHIGFGDVIHKILRSTCNECGRVLLNDDQFEYFTEKIREAMDSRESLNAILKEVYRVAKRELKFIPEEYEAIDSKYCCPHCGAPQEAILLDKPVTIRQGDYKLTASEVRERLEKITDEDSFVLGVNPEMARPEWLVLTVLPVPPVTARPSITLDTGERSEDDLTHKLVDILRINQRLLENMEAGAPQLIVEDLWELLQYHVTTYFDNEASGVPPARHRSGRPLITLIQRLNGHKEDAIHNKSNGRFRDNLSGKRVNFSARTVISPDPNISINEVGVPEMIAKEMTVPVYVTKWNIEEMKMYVINGRDVHPGANYVIRSDGRKINIRNFESKLNILEQLGPGFVIERHLKDGDIVLLNRQPSLHKLSLMAHEVRILPYKTFRINPAVCPPYNADFDGDEMNIHILQTIESRAEARELMLVQENIMSPKSGHPVIGAIRDHISGAYLLTREGTIFCEEEALQIIRKSGLTMPLFENGQWILKKDSYYSKNSYIYKQKGDFWTGKELFSLTLPNDLNMSFSAKISNCSFIQPGYDANVVIIDGILVQGVIDEAAFGSFNGKILDKIFRDYGSKRAKEFLEKAINLSLCALVRIGITNSINDYELPKEAQDRITEFLNSKMVEVDELIKSYGNKNHKAFQATDSEESLNLKVSRILKDARDVAGDIVNDYFNLYGGKMLFSSFGYNSSVMAHTGAKSSMLNITQISACVGQQSIRGQTLHSAFINRGYQNRILPHFKNNELNYKSFGFVKSSFLKGLDPEEFFLHAIGGRDSLVDKAIRVSQSGYMQRRLINALQDVGTTKDGVVKDSQGNVIQTLYGEDGVNPAKTDFGKVIDLDKLIDEIRITEMPQLSYSNDNELNTSNEITEEVKSNYSEVLTGETFDFEDDFVKPLRIFVDCIRDASFDEIQDELKKLNPLLYQFYKNNVELFVAFNSTASVKFDDLVREGRNFINNTRMTSLDNTVENTVEDSFDFEDDFVKPLGVFVDSIRDASFDEIQVELKKLSPLLYQFYKNNIELFVALTSTGSATFDDLVDEGMNFINDTQITLEHNTHDDKGIDFDFERDFVEPIRQFTIKTFDSSWDKVKEESQKLSPLLFEFYDTHRFLYSGLEAGSNTFEDIKLELTNFAIKKGLISPDYNKKSDVDFEKIKKDFEQLTNEYDEFINILEQKIKDFDDEYVDDLILILEYIKGKREVLSNYQLQIIYLNDFEIASKVLKEYPIFLNENREKYREIFKDLKTIKESKLLKLNEINSERKELYDKLYKDIAVIKDEYEIYKYMLKTLNNNADELSDFLENKQLLLDEIKLINNEFIENMELIDDFENKIEEFKSDEQDSIDEAERDLTYLKGVYDEFENVVWSDIETKISKQQGVYANLLNKQNSMFDSEETNKLISQFNECFNDPFLDLSLRKFNLESGELESIKKFIIEDIINQKISGENLDFKFILISYCEEYTKKNNVLSDEELDEILSKIDLTSIDESIVRECKSKIKEDFESNIITKEQIPLKFNKHVDKKLDELKKLEELEMIKNNPNLPEIKQYLSNEDCYLIYRRAEEEICSEFGLRGSVIEYLEKEMYQKNEKNKSDARETFKSFRINRRSFLEITTLQKEQIDSFVLNVELLIGENRIKTTDFNEEFIQELSLSFKKYGKIILL